jgi:hypothetical protein
MYLIINQQKYLFSSINWPLRNKTYDYLSLINAFYFKQVHWLNCLEYVNHFVSSNIKFLENITQKTLNDINI